MRSRQLSRQTELNNRSRIDLHRAAFLIPKRGEFA